MFIFKEFKFLNWRSKSSFMYPESAQRTIIFILLLKQKTLDPFIFSVRLLYMYVAHKYNVFRN